MIARRIAGRIAGRIAEGLPDRDFWHLLCDEPFAMSEAAERLKERTMEFALDVCELIKRLPQAEPGPTVISSASAGTARCKQR